MADRRGPLLGPLPGPVQKTRERLLELAAEDYEQFTRQLSSRRSGTGNRTWPHLSAIGTRASAAAGRWRRTGSVWGGGGPVPESETRRCIRTTWIAVRELANCWTDRAVVLMGLGEIDPADELFRHSIRGLTELVDREPSARQARKELNRSLAESRRTAVGNGQAAGGGGRVATQRDRAKWNLSSGCWRPAASRVSNPSPWPTWRCTRQAGPLRGSGAGNQRSPARWGAPVDLDPDNPQYRDTRAGNQRLAGYRSGHFLGRGQEQVSEYSVPWPTTPSWSGRCPVTRTSQCAWRSRHRFGRLAVQMGTRRRSRTAIARSPTRPGAAGRGASGRAVPTGTIGCSATTCMARSSEIGATFKEAKSKFEEAIKVAEQLTQPEGDRAHRSRGGAWLNGWCCAKATGPGVEAAWRARAGQN